VVAFHGPQLADALSRADLLVNATPVGGWPTVDGSPVPGSMLHSCLTVFDLVSRPRRTRLLIDAGDRGCRVIEGVEMLLRQGARSFEIWTGRPAPLEAMRAAALDALDRDPEPAAASTRGWPS
jgi:shikimate dehydrogenase